MSFLVWSIFLIISEPPQWVAMDFDQSVSSVGYPLSVGSNRLISQDQDQTRLKIFLEAKGDSKVLSPHFDNEPYLSMFAQAKSTQIFDSPDFYFGYVESHTGDLSLYAWKKDPDHREPLSLEFAIRVYLDEKMAEASDEKRYELWKSERALLISLFLQAKRGAMKAQVYRSFQVVGRDFSRLELMDEPLLVRIPAREREKFLLDSQGESVVN